MIGLLPVNHSIKNKREKNHQGGEGNGLKFQCPFLWAIDGFELMYLQLEI